MKHFLHIFILLGGIAGVVLLNKYWKAETAFMKEMADYHLTVEEKIKSRKYNDLQKLSQTFDSSRRDAFLKNVSYLKEIDTTTSKERFYQLLGDSLSEKYAFEVFKDTWHVPPEARDLYRNKLVLESIDSMMSRRFPPMQPQYELVITEVQIRDDYLRFEAEYFEVIQRDTPFVNPSTGEKWDSTDIEFYEAKILEY